MTATGPTLAGRLAHPLTSRAEAIRQLQTTAEITPLARAILKREQAPYKMQLARRLLTSNPHAKTRLARRLPKRKPCHSAHDAVEKKF